MKQPPFVSGEDCLYTQAGLTTAPAAAPTPPPSGQFIPTLSCRLSGGKWLYFPRLSEALRSLNLKREESDDLLLPTRNTRDTVGDEGGRTSLRCSFTRKTHCCESQVPDVDPRNSGEVLAIIGENLRQSLLFHVEGVVRVHEIDVCMDIEIESHKEKRGFWTVQIGCIQDLLDFRGDIQLLQFVK